MKMIQATSLNRSAVIPFQATNEPVPETTAGAYDAVRFNAMTHGILSRLVVLAHENGSDFDDLLSALIEEHRPAGRTERQIGRGSGRARV